MRENKASGGTDDSVHVQMCHPVRSPICITACASVHAFVCILECARACTCVIKCASFFKCDDSTCCKATIMSVNSAEWLAAAQGCCSDGRHMDCKQHIWDRDRQGLACSSTIDDMPSSTTWTPILIISLLSWSSNCICNNTCGHGLWETLTTP